MSQINSGESGVGAAKVKVPTATETVVAICPNISTSITKGTVYLTGIVNLTGVAAAHAAILRIRTGETTAGTEVSKQTLATLAAQDAGLIIAGKNSPGEVVGAAYCLTVEQSSGEEVEGLLCRLTANW